LGLVPSAPAPLAGVERWLVAREGAGQTLCQVQVPFLAEFAGAASGRNLSQKWHLGLAHPPFSPRRPLWVPVSSEIPNHNQSGDGQRVWQALTISS
jgi:hypothetical protein